MMPIGIPIFLICLAVFAFWMAGVLSTPTFTRDVRIFSLVYVVLGAISLTAASFILHSWSIAKVGTPDNLDCKATYKLVSQAMIGHEKYVVVLRNSQDNSRWCVENDEKLPDQTIALSRCTEMKKWKLVPIPLESNKQAK